MKDNKRQSIIIFLTFALTYLFTTFIMRPLYQRIGISDYNIFSNGLDRKFFIGLGFWIVISYIFYFILTRLFFKDKNRKR